MTFSNLQKYILNEVWVDKKNRVGRQKFNRFYDHQASAPGRELRTKIITKSLERLIDKGLMIGFGERTRCKWFIKEVQLTPAGKRRARQLRGEQAILPFLKHRRRSSSSEK